MLRLESALIAAVLLTAQVSIPVLATTPSQQLSPSARKLNGSEQSNATSDHGRTKRDLRGTEQSPLFVKIIPPPNTEKPPSKGDSAKTEKPPTEDGLVFPTWILALATIGLFIYTARLWASTKSMVREERESGKIELRAYLFTKARSILLDGDVIRVFVQVINGGQTPAFNVRIPSVCTIKPPPPYTFDVAEAGASDEINTKLATYTLPKGADNTLSPNAKIADFDKLKDAARDGQRFYVFGLITYSDVFGDDQWVEFCAFLEGKDFLMALTAAESAPRTIIDVAFKVPSFGNDASFNPDHAEAMKNHREGRKKPSLCRQPT